MKVAPAYLNIYQSDGTTIIDVTDSATVLLEGYSGKTPLIVKTIDRNERQGTLLVKRLTIGMDLDELMQNKRKSESDEDLNSKFSEDFFGKAFVDDYRKFAFGQL